MQLEHPLKSLIEYCETMCVAGCCGNDAYDFSPVHIASYLIQWGGVPDPTVIDTLNAQIASIEADYGTRGRLGNEASFDDLYIVLKGIQVDRFCHELQVNLEVALQLAVQGEALRYKIPPNL